MTFPSTNLVAYYEPKNWGYSDSDVINTSTKKFQDDSGNARHLNSAVTGSPLYKTGGLNSLQYVRFSGTSQAVHGSYVADHTVGTIAMVVVPQALPGANLAYNSFNDAGTRNSHEIAYDGSRLYFAYMNGVSTSAGAVGPVLAKLDICV